MSDENCFILTKKTKGMVIKWLDLTIGKNVQ